MSGSIRVACATDSGQLIDGHFGACKAFVIWDVGRQDVEFVEARSTLPADEADDRNAARAALLGDCQVACFLSIGGPAAAKVVRAGVHPLKVAPGTTMDAMVARLQEALASPPPWLAKVMGVEAASLAQYRESVDAGEIS
ncbi:MAG TPA: NifB/NifX family molybdenum-iron cluster-binding protein [Rhodocyclaceae bacterium]|nr:NifB/NifX family molybdenum-iron cluster-binding protein [Rhodocyclaceae bacterium]